MCACSAGLATADNGRPPFLNQRSKYRGGLDGTQKTEADAAGTSPVRSGRARVARKCSDEIEGAWAGAGSVRRLGESFYKAVCRMCMRMFCSGSPTRGSLVYFRRQLHAEPGRPKELRVGEKEQLARILLLGFVSNDCNSGCDVEQCIGAAC